MKRFWEEISAEMSLLFFIPIPAAAGAILSSGCGQCPSLEAAKVAINVSFSFSARASSRTVAAFGSHRQVSSSPIIKARLLCMCAHELGMQTILKVHLSI